jgi:hypothetical protein
MVKFLGFLLPEKWGMENSLHSEGLISYTHWKESNSWWWNDHAPFIPCNICNLTIAHLSNAVAITGNGCEPLAVSSLKCGHSLETGALWTSTTLQHTKASNRFFLIPSHWGTQTGLFQYRWWGSDFVQDFMTGWEVHLEQTVNKHELLDG